MTKKVINIDGMTCSACSNGLEKYLNKQEGIEATVNLIMATASINYDEQKVSIEDINRFIQEAGFKALGEETNKKSWDLVLIICFGLLSLFLMYISMGDMFGLTIPVWLSKNNHPYLYMNILLSSAVLALLWGRDILKNGYKNLIHKMPNMDTLVGMGVIVNFLFSLYNAYFIYQGSMNFTKIYFDSVVMIILFVKLGRFIDKSNKRKAVDVIKNLVTITPKKATVLKEGKEITLTLNEIKKGDIVICKPGEKIAVDGEIMKGSTHTDESFLTGESEPVKKKVGDKCLAGSINYDGYIEYKALKVGKDSSISNIVDLVVEATNTKAPISRVADKISSYFVPFIFLVALMAFGLNLLITKQIALSIEALVTVLVVACPCALGLATPLALVIAIGRASRLGFVIKSSEFIEYLKKIDTIVFDKTGTITKGELSLVDMQIKSDYSKSEILKILASIEKNSNHPLAKSIWQKTKDFYEVSDFQEKSGFGVTAKIKGQSYYAGNEKYLKQFSMPNDFFEKALEFANKKMSIIYLWDDKELLAIFGLMDEIKPHVKELMQDLNNLNYQTIMLTGDNENTAKIIAKEVGITKVHSDVTPEGKLDLIKSLNTHDNVLMLGDGINDSPALKSATIGISVSNGTDISSDASDIIMLTSNMARLVDLFKLGAKTMRIIKENLFWAFIYNLAMVPLATGLLPIKLNPMIASMAMILSSLTVVLNSLRLKK